MHILVLLKKFLRGLIGIPTDTETDATLYGKIAELKKKLDEGKAAIAAAISGKGVASTNADTLPEMATKINSIKMATGTAIAGDVLTGKTFSNNSGVGLAGTMANRGAVSSTLTTNGQSYMVPAGFHNGAGKVTAVLANLVAGNIKKGVTVGGVLGTYAPAPATPTLKSAFFGRSPYVDSEKSYLISSSLTATDYIVVLVVVTDSVVEYLFCKKGSSGTIKSSSGNTNMYASYDGSDTIRLKRTYNANVSFAVVMGY